MPPAGVGSQAIEVEIELVALLRPASKHAVGRQSGNRYIAHAGEGWLLNQHIAQQVFQDRCDRCNRQRTTHALSFYFPASLMSSGQISLLSIFGSGTSTVFQRVTPYPASRIRLAGRHR